MTRPHRSGQVAHYPPGAVILAPDAVRLLARHLAGSLPPVDAATRAVIADLTRMSRTRPPSRDPLHQSFAEHAQSEISTAEAARRLGISTAGVRKRIQRGQLPARHDGRRWHITITDLKGDTL